MSISLNDLSFANGPNLSVVFSAGEDDRMLRAAEAVCLGRIANPVLIGRRTVIKEKISRLSLSSKFEARVVIIDPCTDVDLYNHLHLQYGQRRIASRLKAHSRKWFEQHPTVAAAMLVRSGMVDFALCGGVAGLRAESQQVFSVIEFPGLVRPHTLSYVASEIPLFFCDPYLTPNPDIADLVEMASLATDVIERMGFSAEVVIVSRKSARPTAAPSLARKIDGAISRLRLKRPDFNCTVLPYIDVELPAIGNNPGRRKVDKAQLFIASSLAASSHIAGLLGIADCKLRHGPIMLGALHAAHVLLPTATEREIVNTVELLAGISKGIPMIKPFQTAA